MKLVLGRPQGLADVEHCGGPSLNQERDHGVQYSAKKGYMYRVSQEQLARYAALTILERLTWLDQARQFILLAETEQTARRRAKLRSERAGF